MSCLQRIPELRDRIQGAFGSDYDLEKETPGAYPIFEDLVFDFVLENLDSGQDRALLKRLFDLFEEMANSEDGNVTDLLRIGILESLVYRHEQYRRARQYMGEKTKEFADLEEGMHKMPARRRLGTPLRSDHWGATRGRVPQVSILRPGITLRFAPAKA